MSAQHTPGRLEVDNTGYRAEHNGLCLMIWPECIAVVGAGCPDQPQEANARRLVACWNACHGLPDEFLNSNPIKQLVQSLWERNSELEGQRDELLAAAEKALAECCDLIATPAGDALAAAIAKVKGGAA